MFVGCNIPTKADSKCDKPRDLAERKVYADHVELAKETKVCTSGPYTYYFWVMSRIHVMDECKPHPEVVSVRCIPYCSNSYYLCYVLLDNDYEYKQSYSFKEVDSWRE
jgi:hypothetical protein